MGYTENISKRIVYHNKNKNRSTKNKGPWKLIYSEQFDIKKSA